MMKTSIRLFLLLAGMSAWTDLHAQQTYEEMVRLTVNEQVTTVITASEPVLFVDISTDKVAGDQPMKNTIRLKPKDAGHADGEVLGIVTVVTERYRTQYALLYTTRLQEAVADKEITVAERHAYNNPAVSMSTSEMLRYARRVWNSPARYRNVGTQAHRMAMRLNNIYEAGRQEDLEGHQRAGAGTDARPGAGKRPVVPTRLPQRHRAGEDDLPERQGADHRDERETDFRAHHRLAHRL